MTTVNISPQAPFDVAIHGKELDPFSFSNSQLLIKAGIAHEDEQFKLTWLWERQKEEAFWKRNKAVERELRQQQTNQHTKSNSPHRGEKQPDPTIGTYGKRNKQRGRKPELPTVAEIITYLRRCRVRKDRLRCCVWIYRKLSEHYKRHQQGKTINRKSAASALKINIRTVHRSMRTLRDLGIIRPDQPRTKGQNSISVTNLEAQILKGQLPPKPPSRGDSSGQSRGDSSGSEVSPQNPKTEVTLSPRDPSDNGLSCFVGQPEVSPQFKNPSKEGSLGRCQQPPSGSLRPSGGEQRKKQSNDDQAPQLSQLNFIDGMPTPDGLFKPGDRFRLYGTVLTFVEYKEHSSTCLLISDADDSVVSIGAVTLRMTSAKL